MRRRMKAVIWMTGLWGAAFVLVAAGMNAYGFATSIMPPLPPTLLALKVATTLIKVAAMGCGAGLLFASMLVRMERTRDFSTLSAPRFGLWGFLAGASVFLGVNATNSILTGTPFDSSNFAWAAVYGIVGATIGAATFFVAKRGRNSDDTAVHREAFVVR